MKRALVFPGQGSQYVGMTADLAEKYPLARDLLGEADDILNFALSDIMLNGPDDELLRTDYSQPAILVASYVAYRVVDQSQQTLLFDVAAGLSLGEYTALLVTDALDFKSALKLVALRGKAMQAAAEASKGGMVALIGADEEKANALCEAAAEGGVLQVANLNATGQIVIAGDQDACERAVEIAKDHGARRAVPLPVAGAFHSPHMAPAADELRSALEATTFRNPKAPVYSNVTAEAITEAERIPELLIQQLTSPVRWAQSVEAMQNDGVTHFLELGPGKALCGMIARTVKDVTTDNVDKAADVLTMA